MKVEKEYSPQAARAGAGARADREGAVNSLAAMQLRAFDASMLIAYMQATFETNTAMQTFLAQRFRPVGTLAALTTMPISPR